MPAGVRNKRGRGHDGESCCCRLLRSDKKTKQPQSMPRQAENRQEKTYETRNQSKTRQAGSNVSI
jgi:hypothetical protein